MKKIFFCFFIIICANSFGQIKLNSFPVELKRSSENHSMTNFANEKTNEIYSFVADKETLTAVRFNSAIFFSDSLTTTRPFNYKNIIGYSFSKNNHPILHWITEDNKRINSIEYDFSKNPTEFSSKEISINPAINIAFFEYQSQFFLMATNENNEIVLSKIDIENPETFVLQTSNLAFTDAKNKKITFNQIIKENPLTKMERDFYNPLAVTAAKVKYYLENDALVFTFDLQTSKTDVLFIDLISKTAILKEIKQPLLKEEATQSNSYFLNQKLYQISGNKKEIVWSVFDCKTKEASKNFMLSEDVKNPFENPKYFIQSENYRPEELSSLKRFLKRTDNSNIAFSIFPFKDYFIGSLGAAKTRASSGGIALGIGIGLGSIVLGGDFYDVGAFDDTISQSVFINFEGNENLEFQKPQNEPLATNFIDGFLSDKNNVYLYQTFKYRDYYILSYYDKKAKEVVLYKFQNGF
jgi:hypoxanthine phosphoribosyltransferase